MSARNEKAVAVANDVLARVREGRLTVSEGSYIEGGVPGGLDPDADLRDVADKIEASCDVCALGAAILSKARLYDEVPVGGFMSVDLNGYTKVSRDGLVWYLHEVFDLRQADMIEAAFEGTRCFARYCGKDHPDLFDAVDFGCRYDNSEDRLIAIMENVVANGGYFVPKAGPESAPGAGEGNHGG